MSGHSKWAGIKHKKGVIDAKRGKLFTKLVRELTIAAKTGGGVPENNPRLRKAIEEAKAANMPQDNVKKAIAKGTGEIPGVTFEEVSYEGYGPAGVAVYLTGSTDNRNRTSSEIRKIFADSGGSLGESGCVAWMFKTNGLITVEKSVWPDEEKLMNVAIEAGSDDFKSDDSNVYEVITTPGDFESVKKSLEEAKIPLSSAEITMISSNYITVSGGDSKKTIELLETLEDHDDVSHVYANCHIQGD